MADPVFDGGVFDSGVFDAGTVVETPAVHDPAVYGDPVYDGVLIAPEVYGEAPLVEATQESGAATRYVSFALNSVLLKPDRAGSFVVDAWLILI